MEAWHSMLCTKIYLMNVFSLNIRIVFTFSVNSGSQSKVTSCEITVVLSCRETSGNWAENDSSFPKKPNVDLRLCAAWCLRLKLMLTQNDTRSVSHAGFGGTMKQAHHLLSPWDTVGCEDVCTTLSYEYVKQENSFNPARKRVKSSALVQEKVKINIYLESVLLSFELIMPTAWFTSFSLACSLKLWWVLHVSKNWPRLFSPPTFWSV